MNEFEGPWSRPATPPTPATPPPGAQPPAPKGGFPVGLAIWLGVLAASAGLIALLIWRFPPAMPKADQPDLWYMFGLLALVSSGLTRLRRVNLPAILRNLAIWVGIFAVVLVGYTFRDTFSAAGAKIALALNPEQAQAGGKGEVIVGRGAADGFYVMGSVNGAPMRFLIDTGATDIVLTQADAARVGLHPAAADFSKANETANGVGHGAATTVASLTVGSIRLADVPVEINQAPMSTSLLGMTFLKRLASFEVKGDQLILRGRS